MDADCLWRYAARFVLSCVVFSRLRLGADLGAVDAYGWNALHVAAHEGHCAMARCLAKWDSDARALARARAANGKRPCDVARTQRVRDELDTLWWACARARLDLVRRMARAQQHVDLPRPWPVLCTAARSSSRTLSL